MAETNELRIAYSADDMKEYRESKDDVLEIIELIEGIMGMDAVQEISCIADQECLLLISLAAEENILLGKFDLEYLGVMAARIAVGKFSSNMGLDGEAA